MTEGRINIIDATPIEAAQSGDGKGKDGKKLRDPEAGWHVKKNSRGKNKSTYAYSVHTGCDEDTFIHSQTVTSGNVHDSQARDYLLLGGETRLYADSAYSSADTDNTASSSLFIIKLASVDFPPPEGEDNINMSPFLFMAFI